MVFEYSLAGCPKCTAGGDGVSLMGYRGLLFNGNTNGTSADDGVERGAVLRVALVSAGPLLADATLRRGR
jgi:hypothetical protein